MLVLGYDRRRDEKPEDNRVWHYMHCMRRVIDQNNSNSRTINAMTTGLCMTAEATSTAGLRPRYQRWRERKRQGSTEKMSTYWHLPYQTTFAAMQLTQQAIYTTSTHGQWSFFAQLCLLTCRKCGKAGAMTPTWIAAVAFRASRVCLQ